jgi:phosphotransferase system  glucose/maltose/N-acetylglucosamine-specific IIC component
VESSVVAGDQQSFFVQIRDAFSNNITLPLPDGIVLSAVLTFGNVIVTGEVSYIMNGLYGVTYQPTVSGGYILLITIQNIPIQNPTFPVTVIPGL